MSLTAIQSALEKRLLSLAPQLPTAWENATFTPPAGMWQRVSHLINTPRDVSLALDAVIDQGIFQVSLYAPINTGRLAAMQRAQAIRAHFAPPLDLIEGLAWVQIYRTPAIAGGMPDGDRWHLPISIYWRAPSA